MAYNESEEPRCELFLSVYHCIEILTDYDQQGFLSDFTSSLDIVWEASPGPLVESFRGPKKASSTRELQIYLLLWMMI